VTAPPFSSFPDYSKINEESFNGVREDTFSTPRPKSGRAARASPGGEKRWGVVDNMSIKDLLWVCDQAFTKNARNLCAELCSSVRKEFELERAQIRHDVVQPVAALTAALDRLPSRLDDPLKRIVKSEVLPYLESYAATANRLEGDLSSRFTSVESKLEEVENQQRRASKTNEKMIADGSAHTQDILSQLRSVHSQVMDGASSTSRDLQQVLQAGHDPQGVLEQKVDALLWKHTKQQPVLVDFSLLELSRPQAEEESEILRVTSELASKVDDRFAHLTSRLEAFAEDAKRHVPEEVVRRAPGCDAQVQSEVVQVAEAEVQATEVMARPKKQRARATRHHARASRLSLAQAKELRTGKSKGGPPVFADETEMKKSLRQALVKAPYNVHDYYRSDGCAQLIARHPMFENCTLVVIVLNCLWMAIDTDNNPAAVLIDAPPVFQVAEHLFCTYFFVEITIRFLAFEYKCDCFRDFWFVFDFCLSLYMVAETWILSIVLVVADLRETDSLFSANVLRIIRMVKILRLTRMAKLLRSIPELGIVAKAIGAAGRSLLVIAAFCVMVLYVFALLMKQITDMVQEPPADSALTADFATVATSMNTLLLKSMFAESASFVYSLAAWHPVFWPLIVLFILITSVTMMYMLIGVMVNVVNSVAASEREGSTVSLIAQSLRQVMSKLGMDPDSPLSKQTVTDLLLDAEVAQFLYSLDVDSIVMVEMLDTFYEDIMEKEGRQMNFEDLVDGLLNLRGTNPATVQDVKGSIRILKTSFTKELSDLRKSLLGEINTLKIDLRDGGDLESSGSEHDAS